MKQTQPSERPIPGVELYTHSPYTHSCLSPQTESLGQEHNRPHSMLPCRHSWSWMHLQTSSHTCACMHTMYVAITCTHSHGHVCVPTCACTHVAHADVPMQISTHACTHKPTSCRQIYTGMHTGHVCTTHTCTPSEADICSLMWTTEGICTPLYTYVYICAPIAGVESQAYMHIFRHTGSHTLEFTGRQRYYIQVTYLCTHSILHTPCRGVSKLLHV